MFGNKKDFSKKTFQKAFRDSFGKLGMLRTYFPKVRVMALTATADKGIESRTVKSLSMKTFNLIRVNPNRLNICLANVKCTQLSLTVLSWLMEGIRQYRREYEKTIIYCQSIEMVSCL